MRFGRAVLLVLFCIALARVLPAQSQKTPEAAKAGNQESRFACPDEKPSIQRVQTDDHSLTINLGRTLDVYVCNIAKFLTDTPQPSLFINGIDSGLAPTAILPDRGVLTFRLLRTDANKKLWSELLRYPFLSTPVKLTFSVGPPTKTPLPVGRGVELITLNRVTRDVTLAFVVIVIIVGTLIGFLVMVRKSDILRSGPHIDDKPRQPYSLGRSQMAWWFFLILVGYLMIWVISGASDTITLSLLALMGISAGTALGAVLIDSSAGGQIGTTRTKLMSDQLTVKAQLAAVMTRLGDLNAAYADAVAPLKQQLEAQKFDLDQQRSALEEQIKGIQQKIDAVGATPESKNFIKDILEDETGAVALHRFQIVVWTVVLGVMFIASVVNDLSMPEFPATLLALMGISSGTYLGFKFPEKA